MDEELKDMDVWREGIQQDINELKQGQTELFQDKRRIESDVAELKISDKLQNQEIATLKEGLSEIKDDTKWIRRRITGAIITAIVGAIITGIVGVAIANIF